MADRERQSDWNPSELHGDRTTALDEMRERCPVAFNERQGWSVFRYADVMAVSKCPKVFSNVRMNNGHADPIATRGIPLELDPPEHAAYRSIVQNLFSATRLRGFEPKLRALATERVEAMIEAGRVEAISSFAEPFPVHVLCAFLGWPLMDWREVKDMSAEVRRAMQSRDQEQMIASHDRWRRVIEPEIAARRKDRRDDATSWLLSQRIEGRPLDENELIGTLRLLLVAGHGTTTATIGKVLAFLALNPEHQTSLRENPSRIPVAVEELLRWSGPLVAMQRTVLQETEVGGRKMKPGERVSLMYMAANRDPERFENADKCDLGRRPNRHLAFGAGIHTCLGAPVARSELRIVLEELLARTSHFEIGTEGYDYVPHSWPTDDLQRLDLKLYR